jgi:hypothetical protein
VRTYVELGDHAATEIRARLRANFSDSAHHFVVDHTNYFVEHGAMCSPPSGSGHTLGKKTDEDLRKLIDSANAATLDNIAERLAQGNTPDELVASVQLEGIAYAPPRQLYDILELHGRVFNRPDSGRDRLKMTSSVPAKSKGGESCDFPAGSRPATNQPLSSAADVVLVQIGLVHLEAGYVQCIGKRQVSLVPCLGCCRADALNPIL